MKRLTTLVLMIMALALVNGCALGAAAGGGAVVADEYDEAKECGDDFDPLEDARDKESDCN
ncbi:MAG: hypothetical protein RQ847_01910 [Wenzhouxiangellaceae bacterium]|nr:hypothetical protein [Wenzhouxiangellaceae bacterium]